MADLVEWNRFLVVAPEEWNHDGHDFIVISEELNLLLMKIVAVCDGDDRSRMESLLN